MEYKANVCPWSGFLSKVACTYQGAAVKPADRKLNPVIVGRGKIDPFSFTITDPHLDEQISKNYTQEWRSSLDLLKEAGLWLISQSKDNKSVIHRLWNTLKTNQSVSAHQYDLILLYDSQLLFSLDKTSQAIYFDCLPLLLNECHNTIVALCGIGMFHACCLLAGFSARETAHLNAGLFYSENVTDSCRRSIIELLTSSDYLDAGNTWSLFYEDLMSPQFAEHSELDMPVVLSKFVHVDTFSLDEQQWMSDCPLEVEQIAFVKNHRQHRVSWLLGQSLIDLPYSRQEFRQALSEESSLDICREHCYHTISKFDRSLELSNSIRVSQFVRNDLSSCYLPSPVLLAGIAFSPDSSFFGRESRAFGNQAGLLANSRYIERTSAVSVALQKLIDTFDVQQSILELEQLLDDCKTTHKASISYAHIYIDQFKQFLWHLGPATGRFKALLSSLYPAFPLTQFKGACNQLREVLDIVCRKSSQALNKLDLVFKDKWSRRLLKHEHNSTIFSLLGQYVEATYGQTGNILRELSSLEQVCLSTSLSPVGYSVLLQRPSPTGSEHFKSNELVIKPEQEESLRMLLREGGDLLYMSPSYDWVAECTDVIEAAPLFIYERTVHVQGREPVTVFEVDQQGLEQTIRLMADPFATNIDKCIDSEHISLAREIIVYANVDTLLPLARHRVQACPSIPIDTAFLLVCSGFVDQIVTIAFRLSRLYNEKAAEVELVVEKSWQNHRYITRIDGLREVLLGSGLEHTEHLMSEILSKTYSKRCAQFIMDAEHSAPEIPVEDRQRLHGIALLKRRGMPAFHLLTTEAPGLVESFIQTLLEEEMALRNVIRAFNLEADVQANINESQQVIMKHGHTAVLEFGYEPIVEQFRIQGSTQSQALLSVIGAHQPLQQQVAYLAVLEELASIDGLSKDLVAYLRSHYAATCDKNKDISFTEAVLSSPTLCEKLRQAGYMTVWERNKMAGLSQLVVMDEQSNSIDGSLQPTLPSLISAVDSNTLYAKEFQSAYIQLAREQALHILDAVFPELHILSRTKNFYRDHAALKLTTARRTVIARHKLHSALSDPRYGYSNGVLLPDADGERATGGRKRYHLVYAPSRVNLGKGERKSVEEWTQWIGVSDQLAAIHASRFYELFNFDPKVRIIQAAENLKCSENQWTALVRAVRNVQALFVARLNHGDIEDLAYEFNQRGGLSMAERKENESYSAGPTTGYCIPKDLLFKLFVATHQDQRKLSQIGIPPHLHDNIIKLCIKTTQAAGSFATAGEWEHWCVTTLLSEDSLRNFFEAGSDATTVSKYFKQYVEITGGVIVFHLTHLIRVLGNSGIPSPLLNRGRTVPVLQDVLWSNWADKAVTFAGEQVNRSLVFPMTRNIPESAKIARSLNPTTCIVPERQLRVHFFGTYKGDEHEAPPPDVRFSWTMRSFMILSGLGHEVAMSLDEEGQTIARLSWEGLRSDSLDGRDIKGVQYITNALCSDDSVATNISPFAVNDQPTKKISLAEQPQLLATLREAFPCHNTVGDITMTVVDGVSVSDLLGFSAETKYLLENEAARAEAMLMDKGLSVDQMRANACLRRCFPYDWVPLKYLPRSELDKLAQEVGGAIHALVLKLRGPGTDFLSDMQGQDVVVFSVTHPAIMVLDPSVIRDLMLTGRPQSALCLLDYVCQGRHRVWFDRDVMSWYACCRAVDSNGNKLQSWDEREYIGRKSVYLALGHNQTSALLGRDLRNIVSAQEMRAIQLYRSFEDVLATQCSETSVALFQSLCGAYLSRSKLHVELAVARTYEQQILLNGRFKPRDQIIRWALEELVEDDIMRVMSPLHWLCIGGIFLLNGESDALVTEVLSTVDRAMHRIRQELNLSAKSCSCFDQQRSFIDQLVVRQQPAASVVMQDRKGQMFSVKASEVVAEKAVAHRVGLALQAQKLSGLRGRKDGFDAQTKALSPEISQTMEELASNCCKVSRIAILQIVDELSGPKSKQTLQARYENERRTGIVFAAMHTCIKRVHGEVCQQLSLTGTQNDAALYCVEHLVDNFELNADHCGEIMGNYENKGLLYRFCEVLVSNANTGEESSVDSLQKLLFPGLACMELLHSALALNAILPLTQASVTDDRLVWREIATLFAHLINDHYYEYNPWLMDDKRGRLFKCLYVSQQSLQTMYQWSWGCHRIIYVYLLAVIKRTSEIQALDGDAQKMLLGQVKLGSNFDGTDDEILASPLGSGAPSHWEQLWRTFNHLREIAFIKNDGFVLPYMFSHDVDPTLDDTLDCGHKVNLAFLSPVGRTHYGRALMESQLVGDNLFITRDGFLRPIDNDKHHQVLHINDGYFWVSEDQFLEMLCSSHHYSANQAIQILNCQKSSGNFVPHKGVFVAARFMVPIRVGVVVCTHHHYLFEALTLAGYPTTDKSHLLFELTYNKSLYPSIFNPSHETGVLLPQEIDWLHAETLSILTPAPTHETVESCLTAIETRLAPFARKYKVIVVKGAAESGARNLSRFNVWDMDNSTLDITAMLSAVRFIYDVSLGQNVTIQRAIISNPLTWMSRKAIKQFVDRQIHDNSVSVNLEKVPKDAIYGSSRVILSQGLTTLETLHDQSSWDASHFIALAGLQVATNVGRQGCLEALNTDIIHQQFQRSFLSTLEMAGRRAMVAISKFGHRYFAEDLVINDITYDSYHKRFPNMPECDRCGIPYWWPRYLMLDYIPEPVWLDAHTHETIPNGMVVDFALVDTTDGNEPCVCWVIADDNGTRHDAYVGSFQWWLLEPNVGIGLWPNLWRRELVHEQERTNVLANEPDADCHTADVDMQRVGVSDRIVIRNWLVAGLQFLRSIYNDQTFGEFWKDNTSVDVVKSECQTQPSIGLNFLDQALLATVEAFGSVSCNVDSRAVTNILVEYICRSHFGVTENSKLPLVSVSEFPDIASALEDICRDTASELNALCERLGCKLTLFLESQRTRSRLLDLVFGRLISRPLCSPVCLGLKSDSLDEAQLREKLGINDHAPLLGCVCGSSVLMQHQLPAFSAFYSYSGHEDSTVVSIGVLACLSDWVDQEGLVTRCIFQCRHSSLLLEVDLRSPIRLSHAFIVQLSPVNELQRHEEIHEILSKAHTQCINPLSAVRLASDKMLTREAIRRECVSPECKLISTAEDGIQAFKYFTDNGIDRVVVQVARNTTEGATVCSFHGDEQDAAMTHVHSLIQQYGTAMISEWRGNLLSEGHPFVLRLNIAAGLCVSATAFMDRSKTELSIVASESTRGILAEVLSVMHLSGSKARIKLSNEDWQIIQQEAVRAVTAVGLQIAGVDVVLEYCHQHVVGVICEVNARPGTLVFGEKLSFENNDVLQSVPWPFLVEQTCQTLFWSQSLPSLQPVDTAANAMIFSLREMSNDQFGTAFLASRYDKRSEAVRERLFELRDFALSTCSFDEAAHTCLSISPGRDRVFMGHTDFPGLGGWTLNAASKEEMFLLMQISEGKDQGTLEFRVDNTDPEFSQIVFGVDELWSIAQKGANIQHWQENDPGAYTKAVLCFMLTDAFPGCHQVRQAFGVSDQNPCKRILRILVDSCIPLAAGLSSSSALNGSVAFAISALFQLNFSRDVISQVDFSEVFLGKRAGAADLTAILFAAQNKMSVISSFPEKAIRSCEFPSSLSVLMANSRIPRLNLLGASHYLQTRHGMSDEQISRTRLHFAALYAQCSAGAYTAAVEAMKQNLSRPEACALAGISKHAAGQVQKALANGLLRDLAPGGLIEKYLPELAGRCCRFKRYALILRLLKLVPLEVYCHQIGMRVMARQAALYGLSELERGTELIFALQQAVSCELRNIHHSAEFERIIQLVEWSHDGDRALRDHRHGLKPTAWAKDARTNPTDVVLEHWVRDQTELSYCCGSFQRSIVELDEIADQIASKFPSQAAVRVAAAGLGGSISVYTATCIETQVVEFLQQLGCVVRKVEASGCMDILHKR